MTAEPGESVVVDLDRGRYEGTVIDAPAPDGRLAVLLHDWYPWGGFRAAAVHPSDLSVQTAT